MSTGTGMMGTRKERFCAQCGASLGFIEKRTVNVATLAAQSNASAMPATMPVQSAKKRTVIWTNAWDGTSHAHRPDRS